MSSNSSFDTDFVWAIAFLVGALGVIYEAQVIPAIAVFIVVVIAVAIITSILWLFYQHFTFKPPQHSPTGTDVDLTNIEEELDNEEIAWQGGE